MKDNSETGPIVQKALLHNVRGQELVPTQFAQSIQEGSPTQRLTTSGSLRPSPSSTFTCQKSILTPLDVKLDLISRLMVSLSPPTIPSLV